MRTLAEARLKRSRAVEFLARGYSYDDIARVVGFTNRGSAHRAVSKALSERQAENIDLLRVVEGDRLDALQAALWDQAMAGDLRAVAMIRRIIESRIRLFGLDQRPDGNAGLPTSLVVGAPEGNPGEATDDVPSVCGMNEVAGVMRARSPAASHGRSIPTAATTGLAAPRPAE